jgi:hypothetical protein
MSRESEHSRMSTESNASSFQTRFLVECERRPGNSADRGLATASSKSSIDSGLGTRNGVSEKSLASIISKDSRSGRSVGLSNISMEPRKVDMNRKVSASSIGVGSSHLPHEFENVPGRKDMAQKSSVAAVELQIHRVTEGMTDRRPRSNWPCADSVFEGIDQLQSEDYDDEGNAFSEEGSRSSSSKIPLSLHFEPFFVLFNRLK